MLEMRITIEAPELVGALNNLAAAMGGAKLTPQQGAVAAPQQPMTNPQTAAPAPAPAPAPIPPLLFSLTRCPAPVPLLRLLRITPHPMSRWHSRPNTLLTKSWPPVRRSWMPARSMSCGTC